MDFGDGSTSAEVNPVHVYEREGSYKVALIVKMIKEKRAKAKQRLRLKMEV